MGFAGLGGRACIVQDGRRARVTTDQSAECSGALFQGYQRARAHIIHEIASRPLAPCTSQHAHTHTPDTSHAHTHTRTHTQTQTDPALQAEEPWREPLRGHRVHFTHSAMRSLRSRGGEQGPSDEALLAPSAHVWPPAGAVCAGAAQAPSGGRSPTWLG